MYKKKPPFSGALFFHQFPEFFISAVKPGFNRSFRSAGYFRNFPVGVTVEHIKNNYHSVLRFKRRKRRKRSVKTQSVSLPKSKVVMIVAAGVLILASLLLLGQLREFTAADPDGENVIGEIGEVGEIGEILEID